MCRRHYLQMRKHGRILSGPRLANRWVLVPKVQCRIPGCDRLQEASALCPKHYNRQRTQENRIWLNGIKLASGCTDCGFNTHSVALQFDHVRGEKTLELSDVTHSRERLEAEMLKCEVVCANCHAIRSANRGQCTGRIGGKNKNH